MSQSPIYAVGDIHGHADKLENALDLIARDGGPDAEIVFLGDLVDRGPDSCAVINRLIRGREEGRNWSVVRGNHDHMFARFVNDGVTHDPNIASGLGWLHTRLGGRMTLASYGVEYAAGGAAADLRAAAREMVPQMHRDFLNDLPYHHERGDLLFVHAGIRPGIKLADQRLDDLIWIRNDFLTFAGRHPWLVVHGHTAIEKPHHYGNRINMDGGAGHGRALVPAVIEGRDAWALTDKGRIALKP